MAQKIKQYIYEHGLELGSIAEKIGISVNTFSAMMNGKRKITAEEYMQICNALNVSLDFFAEK